MEQSENKSSIWLTFAEPAVCPTGVAEVPRWAEVAVSATRIARAALRTLKDRASLRVCRNESTNLAYVTGNRGSFHRFTNGSPWSSSLLADLAGDARRCGLRVMVILPGYAIGAGGRGRSCIRACLTCQANALSRVRDLASVTRAAVRVAGATYHAFAARE